MLHMFYHALNRGVDKRTIFLDTQDYARFVHDMFEFNTTTPAANTHRSRNHMFDLRSRTCGSEKLVDIHGWCLMHNHYHLLLTERAEHGISLFLRKLNVGYAKYFNERYKRSGTLFQGRTKKILMDNEAHFLHILNYIHFNPLDTYEAAHEWRTLQISNATGALEYLMGYKWSSYLDYIGTKNFPSILTTNVFQEVFNHKYKEQVVSYLQDIQNTDLDLRILE